MLTKKSFTIQFTGEVDTALNTALKMAPTDYIDKEGLEQVLRNYGYENVSIWNIQED